VLFVVIAGSFGLQALGRSFTWNSWPSEQLFLGRRLLSELRSLALARGMRDPIFGKETWGRGVLQLYFLYYMLHLIRWVTGAFSPEVKRPECEAYHSPPTNADV
jgi:hypothetical protein